MRSFLKDPGHADAYGALTITWKSGSNPDLYLKAASGAVVEKIDLSKLTREAIHDLLISKGLERNASGVKTAPRTPAFDKKTTVD